MLMRAMKDKSDEAGWDLKKAEKNVEEIINTDEQLNNKYEDMDELIRGVINTHEQEFMQAYNIYVKKKEKELIDIIQTLEARNAKNNLLDIKIKNLEATIRKLHWEAQVSEQK